jgi:hypothetical protein
MGYHVTLLLLLPLLVVVEELSSLPQMNLLLLLHCCRTCCRQLDQTARPPFLHRSIKEQQGWSCVQFVSYG